MNWYEKAKKEKNTETYTGVGHRPNSKAWCLIKDELLEKDTDERGRCDLHLDNYQKMWAYGRIDFSKNMISIGINMENVPEIYIEDPLSFAKSIVREKYPGMKFYFSGLLQSWGEWRKEWL